MSPTYPFEIIDEFKGLSRSFGDRGNRGDTVVGNDVWIGQKQLSYQESISVMERLLVRMQLSPKMFHHMQ